MVDVTVDDPSDWPLQFVELKPLVGGDLKCNRILDELVGYFKQIREQLIGLIKRYLKYGFMQATLDKNDGKDKADKEKNISDDEFEFTALPSYRSPNKSRRMENKRDCGGDSNQTEMTSCPVCGKKVPIERINFHLDECLKEQDDSSNRQKTTHIPSTSSQVAQSSKRKRGESKTSSVKRVMKPIPKSCLNALQDKELKSKANQYGLSMQGDRKQLIKRIEQYILLYNSQCDGLNPMSASMVAKQVGENERNLLKHGYTPGIVIHTHNHRYSDQEKEDFNIKYGQENEKHYQQLIAEIKEKQSEKNQITNKDKFTDKLVKIANNELVIEVIDDNSPPDKQAEEITDHSAFGHVPDWFDADLLKTSSTDKKIHDQSKVADGNLTGKPKKSTSATNKKKPVKSGNIVSYFSQKSSVDKKSVDNRIEVDLTKQKGKCSSIKNTNEVDSKFSVKLANKQNSLICLVEDTDDDDDDDEIMPCKSQKLSSIYLSDEDDEIMPCTSRKSPSIYETEDQGETMPESPSILETEEAEDLYESILPLELQCNAAVAFNSTAAVQEPQVEVLLIDTDLSPVCSKETSSKSKITCLSRSKRAGSFSLESRLNCLAAKNSKPLASPVEEVNTDDLDNSLDSHCSELNVEISNLVDRAIENPHAFSSDSENEFSSNKLSSVPMNILQKNAIIKETHEKENYSNSENVIPIPPSDLNFSESDFY